MALKPPPQGSTSKFPPEKMLKEIFLSNVRPVKKNNNNAKFSGHYVQQRTHKVRAHLLPSHQYWTPIYIHVTLVDTHNTCGHFWSHSQTCGQLKTVWSPRKLANLNI